MSIAVIIPAYNEAKSVRQIAQHVLQHHAQVIVIDDGSTDQTAAQVANLPLTLLRNEKNLGKAASLLRAFTHAQQSNLEAVITLDADTQHNPDDIPKFIAAMRKFPNHIIIGARLRNTHMAPRKRLFANKIADFFVSWTAGTKILDSQSGYRLYPMSVLHKAIHHQQQHASFVFESEILIDAVHSGAAVAFIAIDSHYPANARQSHFRPLKDTTKIGLMVARKIIARGMNLPGLVKVLLQRNVKLYPEGTLDT